ncbi:MAG: AbrB/MazE/SpoVT family DNA-binding domain-containing protein, partial [Proteobacteria bacterium]|nr:AbrB/MazE/SpoVT family DNA-binding domain-containing protein [Pseudomonadota bacterium]
KVTPKGQVTLPKKLRERLMIRDLLEIEVQDREGTIKKPEKHTDKLAGCFQKYALKKRIPLNKAIGEAVDQVACEIATKHN